MQTTTLYDTDFVQWTEQQAQYLRDKKSQGLDWGSLAEEIEDLGRSDCRAASSLLKRILQHLACLDYWVQDEQYRVGWQDELDEFRDQLQLILDDSPSLVPYLASLRQKEWTKAKRIVERKAARGRAKLDPLPKECPYTFEQVLDPDFFGDRT